MSDDAVTARVEKLEERAAFQEQTIEETEQWKLLEAFKRDVARLTDQLKAVEEAVEQGVHNEPPPPHY